MSMSATSPIPRILPMSYSLTLTTRTRSQRSDFCSVIIILIIEMIAKYFLRSSHISISKSLSFLGAKQRCFGFAKSSELEKLSVKKKKDLDDIIPEINKPREADGGIFSVERVIQK